MREKIQRKFFSAEKAQNGRPEEVFCALCQGELYPGDRYFALEGRVICEVCLERYARRYFSGQLRRVSPVKGGTR